MHEVGNKSVGTDKKRGGAVQSIHNVAEYRTTAEKRVVMCIDKKEMIGWSE